MDLDCRKMSGGGVKWVSGYNDDRQPICEYGYLHVADVMFAWESKH